MVTRLAVAFDRPVATLDGGAVELTRRQPGGSPWRSRRWPRCPPTAGPSCSRSPARRSSVGRWRTGTTTWSCGRPGSATPRTRRRRGPTRTIAFHRLFADADGDRDVDGLDSRGFRGALGSEVGLPAYNPVFDFDADGDVDGLDSRHFRQRLGTEI
jgi:hypothetical protein